MPRLTLHLVPEAAWDGRDPATPYTPAAYAQDGFIHCTDGDDEMIRTANRFYRVDPQPFLVLTVDLQRTGSPWRFDEPGRPYPHVYGPIDPAAVLHVRRFGRDADGTFTGIEER
jgi:uncharacterized protein (DUF952 family)